MKKARIMVPVLAAWLAQTPAALADETGGDWSIDVGIHGFKTSSDSKPAEIGYNAVFDRWERISQGREDYRVEEYNVLEPLYFNMVIGLDVMVRYRKYFWLRLGYDYTNPLGIGGQGNIAYEVETEDGTTEFHEERKKFQYTSHQLSLFFGPTVPVAKDLAEVYLGFAPMAPIWVAYEERYQHKVDGGILEDPRETYDMTLTGFFGSCRALVGAQVKVWRGLKLGSELVFTYLNYMEVSSGKLSDSSFRFPSMTWNFTARYQVL